MLYLVVNDGVILNIIVCSDPKTASELGFFEWYEEAVIGEKYNPPDPPAPEPAIQERVKTLELENALLKAQLQAQTDRSDFVEDCIAELAVQVYTNGTPS